MDITYKRPFNLATLATKKVINSIVLHKEKNFTLHLDVPRLLELSGIETQTFSTHFKNAIFQSNSFICNEKVTIKMRFQGCIHKDNEETFHEDFESETIIGDEKTAHFFTRIETVYPYQQTDITMTVRNGIPHHDHILAEIIRVKCELNYSPELTLVDYRLWVEYSIANCSYGDRSILFKSSNCENMPNSVKEYLQMCFEEVKLRVTNEWNPKVKSKISYYRPLKIDLCDTICPCSSYKCCSFMMHFETQILGPYPQMCKIGMDGS